MKRKITAILRVRFYSLMSFLTAHLLLPLDSDEYYNDRDDSEDEVDYDDDTRWR
jgi:hypothetical protein